MKETYTLVTSEAQKTYPLIDEAVVFPKEKDYGTAQVVDELYPAVKGTILKQIIVCYLEQKGKEPIATHYIPFVKSCQAKDSSLKQFVGYLFVQLL